MKSTFQFKVGDKVVPVVTGEVCTIYDIKKNKYRDETEYYLEEYGGFAIWGFGDLVSEDIYNSPLYRALS